MSEEKKAKFSQMTRFAIGGKYVAGETVLESQKNYIIQRAKENKINPDLFKTAIIHSFDPEWSPPEDMTKDEVKRFKALMKIAQADYKEAQVVKVKLDKEKADKAAAEKAAKERAKAEEVEKAKEMHDAFLTASTGSVALAKPMDRILKEAVAKALHEDFTIKDGKIELKDDSDPVEAFAKGFANLKTLIDKTKDLEGGIAMYEAQLAITAETVHGDNWPNFFGDSDGAAISRIKKGMKAVKMAEELGVDITDVPLSTVRALFEAKYDRTDEENNKKLKKAAFDTFVERSEEAGRTLPQTAAKAIVKEVAVARTEGASKKPQWDWIYINKDGSVTGSKDFVIEAYRVAVAVVTTDSDYVTEIDKDGDVVLANVPAHVVEVPAEVPAEPKAEKKGKKAKAEPEEEEKDEVLTEVEESSDDDAFSFTTDESDEELEIAV